MRTVAPGDNVSIEFQFIDGDGNPYDPIPAPTVDVLKTALDLAHTTLITDAAMVRGSPTITGTYYYVLAVSGAEVVGVALEVVATTTDTGIPLTLRSISKSFEVGLTETDALDELLAAVAALTAGQVVTLSPVDALSSNITVYRGDDYKAAESRKLQWTSSAWTAYDLTDAVIVFRARWKKGTATLFETVGTVETGILVSVELTHDETEDFSTGNDIYYFDVEATLTNDDIITLVSGTMSVVPDVR